MPVVCQWEQQRGGTLPALSARQRARLLTRLQVAGLFRVLTNWGWTTPIILAPVEERPDSGLRSWNPSNPTDRRHVMKVITPGFPHVNSTFNMSASTLALLQRGMLPGAACLQRANPRLVFAPAHGGHVATEFRRADQLCTAIALKRATWKQLVEPPEVFAMYPAFLRVQIQYLPPAPSDTDPDTFHEWCVSCAARHARRAALTSAVR